MIKYRYLAVSLCIILIVLLSVNIYIYFKDAKYSYDSSWEPDWYTSEMQSLIINELTDMGKVIFDEMVLCFTLADITDDGIPELFLGSQSGMKTHLVDYRAYSLVDHTWIMSQKTVTYNHQGDSFEDNNPNPFLFQDDYRFELFRGYYFIDGNSDKYYISGSYNYHLGMSGEGQEWLFEPTYIKIQFKDDSWITEYSSDFNKLMPNYVEYGFLPTSTVVVDRENMKESITQCIMRYNQKQYLR